MKRILVLAGKPGAGKGTFSKKLCKLLGNLEISFSLIETSNILKKDKKFQEIIASGALVKDSDVINALKEPLKKAEGLIILDGFPRTVEQAKFLVDLEDYEIIVLKIEAENSDIIVRTKNRRICSKCGASYSLLKKELMPKAEGVCDSCGGELIIRADDAKIEKRLNTYEEETEPAIMYLIGKVSEFNVADSDEILDDNNIKNLAEHLRLK